MTAYPPAKQRVVIASFAANRTPRMAILCIAPQYRTCNDLLLTPRAAVFFGIKVMFSSKDQRPCCQSPMPPTTTIDDFDDANRFNMAGVRLRRCLPTHGKAASSRSTCCFRVSRNHPAAAGSGSRAPPLFYQAMPAFFSIAKQTMKHGAPAPSGTAGPALKGKMRLHHGHRVLRAVHFISSTTKPMMQAIMSMMKKPLIIL